VTIPMGTKFINIPSIHDGVQYSEDEIIDMLKDNKIEATSVHDSMEEAIEAAKARSPKLLDRGGSMESQMDMFEEGGLKDEGGTVDPVSGNDVPSGSTQAEVRDDIPAQLSEGEFVFPADVVRYIGLENLMELRSKAKQGLAKMEAMGQMGNADEATMDDSDEYEGEIDELIENFNPDDPSTFEFNEGGVVMAQQGTYVPPNTGQQQFSYGYGYGAGTGYTPPGQQPAQYPQYGQFISRPAQQAAGQQPPQMEDRQYIGPNGELITIRFVNGKPQQEVPAGFKVYKPEEAVAPTAPTVAQPTTDGGGADEGGGDNREAYESWRSDMTAMAAIDKALGDGKFAEQWSNSPHVRGANLGDIISVGKNIANDFDMMSKAGSMIDKYASAYGLKADDYKNTGVTSNLPGNKYNLSNFVRDARAGKAPKVGDAKDLEGWDGTAGFLDDNRYIDSSGAIRDTSLKSAETKAGLEIAGQNANRGLDSDDGRTTTTGGKGSTSYGYDPSMAEDYGDQSGGNDDNGGLSASPGDVGDTPGHGDWGGDDPDDWNKGGVILQTQRALKSSRKKK